MRSVLVVLSALSLIGCKDQAPNAPMYYERVIQPILTNSCVRNQGSCHKDDGTGNALGNLDLTSYANITRRRDVLRTFGAYPVPLLLLKAVGPSVPPIPYNGAGDGSIKAPMHGKVLELFVRAGEAVAGGQRVAVLEAMKMEHTLRAPFAGLVADVTVGVGAQVVEGAQIMMIERSAAE